MKNRPSLSKTFTKGEFYQNDDMKRYINDIMTIALWEFIW